MTLLVMQARMSSKRLPGKSMLPFCDMPMAIFAARRASNLGSEIILGTSDHPTDDRLHDSASSYGIDVRRGPLEDVLSRFILILQDRSDDDIVVRLTADNVLPDGLLINEVVDEFSASGLDYLTTTHPESGLPYGLSVEATYVKFIRESDLCCNDLAERENVMGHIRNSKKCGVFSRYSNLKSSEQRVTIDHAADYYKIKKLFSKHSDPINVSWKELCGVSL